MAGSTSYAAGQGSVGGGSKNYPPSVVYMVVLVIVEMFVFAFIAKHV
jgi:hypothetical protein